MAMVNQMGEEIKEEYFYDLSLVSAETLGEVLTLVLDHLRLVPVRTNATKHGSTQIVLRSFDS